MRLLPFPLRHPLLHSTSSSSLPLLHIPHRRPPSILTPAPQFQSTSTSSSSSLQHSSLATFLSHASRTGLSTHTSTYKGTRYEYLTQQHLTTLGFNLTRTGRRGDSGIDLLGSWNLFSSSSSPASSSSVVTSPTQTIRTLIQCKRYIPTRTATPSLIRELEGMFAGAPASHRGENVLALLVCTRPATKGIREAMGRSQRGIVWVCLEEVDVEVEVEDQGQGQGHDEDRRGVEDEDEDGGGNNEYTAPETRIRQFLFNQAAASCGLEGLTVGLKYTSDAKDKEVVLQWKGRTVDTSPA